MTPLNESKLQKPEPGDRTQESGLLQPAAGISETSWQIIILAISMVVILFSVYCLSHGITIIFMHLYYLPIVLLAYRYRYRGFVLSVILSLAYIVLVLFYSTGQNEVIIGALIRFVVFIGIAAVVAYLSEQFIQSEKSLKKVADIQKSSLMNANVWLMLLDRRGSVLLWNNAAERISGYSAEEVTGSKDIWKLLYPDKDYRAAITKKIERILAEDSFFENLETTIRTRNGEEKVISWNTRSFPVTSEQESSSIAIGIDITERKRAEDALRIKNTVFESSIAANSIADNQGIITSVNPAFLLIWGYRTKEDAIGKSIASFFAHEKDAVPVLETLDTFGRWVGEFTALRVDGSTFIAFGIATVIRDETGKQIGYQSTLLDITERKRAEEALRKNAEELHAAYEQLTAQEEELRAQYDALALNQAEWESTFNAITDWISLISPDGQILRTNKAVESLLGVPAGEIFGRKCFELVHGTVCPIEGCPRMRMLVSGKQEIAEIPMRDGAGWIQVTVDPVTNSAGGVVSAVHIVRDITERMRSQKALEQAKKKLNLLNYVTFSDIQNMIFSLSGYQQLAKEIVKEGPAGNIIGKQEEILQKISHSLKFVQSYQDLGLKPPQWQNVNQVFLLAISHLDFLRIKHTVLLDGLEIFADPLLEQVFQILADNILTHGKTATQVTFGYILGPASVTLFFEDDGAGIPADTKEKIFLPDFPKKKGEGLFLAREILDITGITIRETGEPGKGARFEMTVPKWTWRLQS